MGHAAPPQLAGADLERLRRAFHGIVGEFAGRGHPLAQPHDPREGVDHAKARAPWSRHQQPAGIGAEIEGGEHAIAPIRTTAMMAHKGTHGRAPLPAFGPTGLGREPVGKDGSLPQ
jgi:hypothetical protein